ncbi:MAG TPA: hypothetical protein VI756_15785, partial [Blastocatellia bacterium]
MLILALFQTKMPWGVMIVSALLGLVAAWLVVYFYRRFKKSESEAEGEDDWGPRGLRLSSEPAPARVISESEPHDASVADEPAPERMTAPLVSADASADVSAGGDTSRQETLEGLSEPRLQPTPPVTALNPQEAIEQSLAEELTEQSPERQTLTMTTPLGDQIWAKSDSGPQGGAVVDQRAPQYVPLEPYEPPRIEPIVPRKPAAGTQPKAMPSAPISGSPVNPTIPIPSLQDTPLPIMSAAERSPQREARLVRTPESSPESSQTEGAEHLDGPSARSGDGSGAGRPQSLSHHDDMADIGTLANYGKSEDDGGGRGGTIALAAVLLLVVAGVLAYIFIPSVHSALTKGNGAEADAPKAQIFITRAEVANANANSNAVAKNNPSPNQQKMKGTVQNTTNESLGGLVVGI